MRGSTDGTLPWLVDSRLIGRDPVELLSGPLTSLMWRKKASSERDAYVVTVIHGEDMSIREFREIQDEPGREACDEFETIDLPRQKDDSFPSAFWRTECFRGGAADQTLGARRGSMLASMFPSSGDVPRRPSGKPCPTPFDHRAARPHPRYARSNLQRRLAAWR